MEIDETGENLDIHCYVLDSINPLWQGELKDCAALLGTNALTNFGFEVVYSNGIPIHSVYKDVTQTEVLHGFRFCEVSKTKRNKGVVANRLRTGLEGGCIYTTEQNIRL